MKSSIIEILKKVKEYDDYLLESTATGAAGITFFVSGIGSEAGLGFLSTLVKIFVGDDLRPSNTEFLA